MQIVVNIRVKYQKFYLNYGPRIHSNCAVKYKPYQLLSFGIVTQVTLIYYKKHLYEQIHRLCRSNESSSPAHFFAIRGKKEVLKIAPRTRLMESWKQCALQPTTMTIWQIKPLVHDVLFQLCSSCSRCMRYSKAIDAIIGRPHCFHACIYIMPAFLQWDLSNVCRVSLTTTYVIYTYIDICGSKWQVGNSARHFCLSCSRCVVNSSVDRTEMYVWI